MPRFDRRARRQAWTEVLLELKARGLEDVPKLAVGVRVLGFWKALKIYPKTIAQRCWANQIRNILDKMPKSLHGRAKEKMQDIYKAESREKAKRAMKLFEKNYEAKHPEAMECLTKDGEELLTFYDFPGGHKRHLRTTNPVESKFATIELRASKTRGCLSRRSGLGMI